MVVAALVYFYICMCRCIFTHVCVIFTYLCRGAGIKGSGGASVNLHAYVL